MTGPGTTGPNRQRLDAGLEPTKLKNVNDSVAAWSEASTQLSTIARGLRQAADSGATIGGRTGPAIWASMRKAADQLDHRAVQMGKGSEALVNSAAAILDARHARKRIDIDLPPLVAQPYKTEPGDDELNQAQLDKKKQAHNNTQNQLVADRETAREKAAKKVADDFELAYAEPIETMKKIYGYTPPPPSNTEPPPPASTPPGGTAPGTGTHHTHHTSSVVQVDVHDDVSDQGGHDHGGTDEPPHDDFPGFDPIGDGDDTPGDHSGHDDPTSPQPSPTPDQTAPTPVVTGGPGHGVPGGVLGGVAVTAGLAGVTTGLVRSGALTGGTAALSGAVPSGRVAPIGSTARPAGPGTLGGRGALSGGTASGRPSGGRGAAGGRGAGAGGQGTRGGRGRGKDRDGAPRDLFDDGQDWLDDDDAGPDVLA